MPKKVTKKRATRPAPKAPKPPARKPAATRRAAPASIDDLVRTLPPETAKTVQALRALILAADPAITEGIKWNSPSFLLTDWFATINTRTKRGVLLVLHHGATKRHGLQPSDIPDPAGLLRWQGPDRAIVSLETPSHLSTCQRDLAKVISHWIVRHKAALSPGSRRTRP